MTKYYQLLYFQLLSTCSTCYSCNNEFQKLYNLIDKLNQRISFLENQNSNLADFAIEQGDNLILPFCTIFPLKQPDKIPTSATISTTSIKSALFTPPYSSLTFIQSDNTKEKYKNLIECFAIELDDYDSTISSKPNRIYSTVTSFTSIYSAIVPISS